MIFDRSREKGGARTDCKDVLFVDASGKENYLPGKNQNILSAQHIQRIVDAYQSREGVEKYACVANLEEIRENDFNLNIPRYVDTFEEEEEVDIDAVQREISDLEKELSEVRVKMAKLMEDVSP